MSNSVSQSRRQLLQFMASAPALSLPGMALAAHGHDRDRERKLLSVTFNGMPVPNTIEQKAKTYVASSLTVNFKDGGTRTYPLSYQPFFLTGDLVPDGRGGKVVAGGYVDIHNQPIIDNSVPTLPRQHFSDSPDGSTLLKIPGARVPGVKGHTVFAVVQFEYATYAQDGVTSMYGTLPSPIAVLTLDQNPRTGELKLVKYHNVDTSGAHGLWITCGASLSPWGTHLSSEEYEPDPRALPSYFAAFEKNLGIKANPYHYGHLPEITVNPDGTGTCRKHYCLGRISHELVQVMPDNRTVLMGDDATNGGLFLFIADRPRDLSSGHLYVARLKSPFTTATLAGTTHIDLEWISLGHASSSEIEGLIDGGITQAQIMDIRSSDPADASFTKIYVSGAANWVKILPGMEQAAAFLETHRYAALKGATMAWTKLEGTTVNARDKVAYSALQNMENSMVKGKKGWYAESNVSLDYTVKAGAVLAHDLRGGQKDSTGVALRSEWVPARTRVLLTGRDLLKPGTNDVLQADAAGNTADPDFVANPDNLKFSEKLRTLFIGEDSSQHYNNFLWAYNVDTKKLSRLMSMPAGGEATGLHAVDEIHGFTYIMSNFQHAGDERPDSVGGNAGLQAAIKANYGGKFKSAVGYLTAKDTGLKLD